MNEVILCFQDATTKVFFTFAKTDGVNFEGNIIFNFEYLNIGDGFDLENGVVTVKNPGVYRFTFSGQSGFWLYEDIDVEIKKNDHPFIYIGDKNVAGEGNNISYVWMMELNQGDTVALHSTGHLYVSSFHPLIFTGELIYKQ